MSVNKGHFLEVFYFAVFKLLYFFYVVYFVGAVTQLGDSASYLSGSSDFDIAFGATYLMLFFGKVFGSLGFTYGNLTFAILLWSVVYYFLLKYFSRSERFFVVLLSFFPTIGAYTLVFSKEAILFGVVVAMFSFRRSDNLSGFVFCLFVVAFFKPAWGFCLTLFFCSLVIIKIRGSRASFVFSFLIEFVVSCAVYLFLFVSSDIGVNVLRSFHLYFSEGNTSFAVRFWEISDFVLLLPQAIFAWFLPQAVEFLGWHYFIFDLEGLAVLAFFILKAAPIKPDIRLSVTNALFWKFVILFSVSMSPYVLFNLGSTLRYRSLLMFVMLFVFFEVQKTVRLQRGG